MPMNSKTQRSRNRKLFITPETVGGTPVYPSTTDAFLASEISDFSQETQTAEVNEYTDQLLKKQEVVTGFGYASPKLTIHPRFGASAGDAPADAILLKNFFGTETVDPGVSVKYTWADHDETLCAWHQITDVIQQVAAGVVVSEMTFTVGKTDLLAFEYTLQSNRIMHNSQGEVPAGTGLIVQGASVVVPLDTNPEYLANVGSKFDVYDTSGALVDPAVEVTAVSSTDVTIATTTIDYNDGFVFKPTLPAGTYATALPFAPTEASIYLGDPNITRAALQVPANKFLCREMSVSMNKNIQTPTEDELNGSLYGGAEYEIDSPTIEISTTLNLRPSTARLFETAKRDMLRSLCIEVPYQGRSMVIFIPEVFMVISDGGENAGAMQQQADFRISAGTAANDAGRFELWFY
jgi:hypothetical protein